MKIKVINLLGGPGSGKSTISSKLFSDMKINGYNVDFVHEYIKKWTYLNLFPNSFDQLYVTAKQIYEIDIRLRNNVNYVVVDGAPVMGAFYAQYNNMSYWKHLIELIKNVDAVYPPLNIFINVKKDEKKYNKHGRFHSLEQSIQIDKVMLRFLLDLYDKNRLYILPRNYETIKTFVLSKLFGGNNHEHR